MMIKIIIGIINVLNQLTRDKRGVTLTVFAALVPVLIAATGVAVDTGRAYLVKKRLGQSLDAAAIAAAGSSGTDNVLKARMRAFFHRNFEAGRFATIEKLEMTTPDSEVRVEATVRVSTVFMRIFGINHLDVSAKSVVQKELRGIEVVLVLDNTGSMNDRPGRRRNGPTNMDALKTASKDFINIMFNRAPDPSVVKIGMVPYSTSVNVGRYGLGKYPDGSTYGSPFVNNPYNRQYTTNIHDNDKSKWMGCVLEKQPSDTEDHSGPWDMYRFCRKGNNNNPESGCLHNWEDSWRQTPNWYCPEAPIMPLTSNRQDLLSHVNRMLAHGYTLGNIGMVWGWRVISPEPPFEEGAAWGNDKWRKAVIMMTDGDNNPAHSYSAYGFLKGSNGNSNPHKVTSTQQINAKFAQVCQKMKQKEIVIYTITFTSGISENTRNYYRNCASDSTKYYNAPSQQDLQEAFEAIARELSNMYIKS